MINPNAKILIPPSEILKQINTILLTLLYINNLNRKKLIADKDQGGIPMIDLTSKFQIYPNWIIEELATTTVSEEVQKNELFNLSYGIKLINKKLFINFEPHVLTPNETWNDLFWIFMKIKSKIKDCDNVTHQQLHLALKEKGTISCKN